MDSRPEILDACVLINLYASGFLSEVISSRQTQCFVIEQVLQESLYIHKPGDKAASFTNEAIELDSYFQAGTLEQVKLKTATEQELFVNISLQLDDGEAATMAYAISHKIQMITDDKKAIRILLKESPDFKCLSTLDLIKDWSEKLTVDPKQIKAVLSNILKYANYHPGKDHPLFGWWQRAMEFYE